MDFDIEMEDAAGAYPGETLPPAGEDLLATEATEAGEIATGDAQEPGEIDEAAEAAQADRTLIPNKVHLRGLDTMTPDDVQAYIREHVGAAGSTNSYDRIEWIDDSSANLVFASETAAAAAVTALCAMPIDDATQLPVGELLPARPYAARTLAAQAAAAQAAQGDGPDAAAAAAAAPAHTGLPLQVRFAVASDKKQVGAASRSRFYLLHPEYDPEERQRFRNRRRDDRGGGGRGRDRDRDRDRDYRARYRSNREDDDRREEDIRNNSFDVNLYDDDEAALAKRTSRAAPGSGGRRRRGRSRSSWSQSSRSRSGSRRRGRNNNADKELFGSGSGSGGGGGGGRSKELFPDKIGGAADEAGTGTRGSGSGSGRQLRNRSASPMRDYDDDKDGRLADARAVAASEAASRNRDKARAIKDRLSTAKNSNNSGRDLFGDQATIGMAQMDLLGSSALSSRLSDRITRPSNGRVAKTATNADGKDGSTFNIRGMAGEQTGESPGLSIKGAATARELFPDRFGSADNGSGRNAGKEVFSDRLENRVRRRQRAEDLFH